MSSVFRTGTQGAQGLESIGIGEELMPDMQQHQGTEGAGGKKRLELLSSAL